MSNSKVVVANYYCQSTFKIPKGLDLEDKTKVKSWGIKWNKLFITLVDDSVIKVKCDADAEDYDFKWPDEATIEPAEDFGMESDCEEDIATVTGAVCKKCNTELPPHTASVHLDATNKIHECPHVDC